MNGLKVVFGGSVNGVAAVYFIWARMVYWPYVVLMAVAAILGGYGGAGTARKLGRTAVRRIVIAVGFGMAISLFVRNSRGRPIEILNPSIDQTVLPGRVVGVCFSESQEVLGESWRGVLLPTWGFMSQSGFHVPVVRH